MRIQVWIVKGGGTSGKVTADLFLPYKIDEVFQFPVFPTKEDADTWTKKNGGTPRRAFITTDGVRK